MLTTGSGAREFLWTHAIFFIVFSIFTPIYLVIFVCIWRLRTQSNSFKTTFYALLLQHTLADIIALSFYAFQKSMIFLIPNVIYDYQEFGIPAFFYNGIMWLTVVRSHGVAMLTLHRYLSVVKYTHSFTKCIQHSKPYVIWLLYWLPPLLFDSLFFTDTQIWFESVESLTTVMDKDIVRRNSIEYMSFLIVSCIICIVCYTLIGNFIRNQGSSVRKVMSRELRLSLHVFLLLLAQIVLLVHMAFMNWYYGTDNIEMKEVMRGYTPLVNGLLSFLSLFLMLLFNKDLTSRIVGMLTGNRKESIPAQLESQSDRRQSLWKTRVTKLSEQGMSKPSRIHQNSESAHPKRHSLPARLTSGSARYSLSL